MASTPKQPPPPASPTPDHDGPRDFASPFLVVATSNPGKVREINVALSNLGIELRSLADLGLSLNTPEDGKTYAENAAAKALDAARASQRVAPQHLTLADDSGLEVDALDGAPGVRTSRYFGEGLSDPEKVQRLLERLANVAPEERGARFRCVVVLAWPSGRTERFEGVCEGTLSSEPRGDGGFGFDPVFIPREHDRTFAQLPRRTKDAISHRARALAETRKFLHDLLAAARTSSP